MSFSSPFWLIAASAALLVVLLHAQRRKQVEVSSLLLFQRLVGASATRPVWQRPKMSWLLLLQILVVLLLALALARPIWDGDQEPDQRIYVLDVSGSMTIRDGEAGASRFEHAVDALRADVLSLDRASEHRLSLITQGASARPIATAYSSVDAFLTALDSVAVTHATGGGVGLNDLLNGIGASDRSDIRVFSDGGLSLDSSYPAAKTFTFGTDGIVNSAIAAKLARTEGEKLWRVEGKVTLLGEGELPQVKLHYRPLDGNSFLDIGQIELRASRAIEDGGAEAAFSYDLNLPGAGVLQLSLPSDMVEMDSVYRLAVPQITPSFRALYIGEGNTPVNLALDGIDGVEVFTSRVLPGDVDSYDIVFAENVVLPRVPNTNVVWLGSARGPSEAMPEPWRMSAVVQWQREHSLTRGVSWFGSGELPAYQFDPMTDGVPLLTTQLGHAIEARTTAYGREVRIALDFASQKWVAAEHLPLLIARIVDWVGGPARQIRQCTVGVACVVPSRHLQHAIFAEDGQQVWSLPALQSGNLPDEVTDSFVPDRSGIYTTADGRVIVVNGDGLEPLLATSVEAEQHSPKAEALWRWLVVAVVIVLLVEAVLAGRGAEGFLVPRLLGTRAIGAQSRRRILIARCVTLGLAVSALFLAPLPTLMTSFQRVKVVGGAPEDCVAVSALGQAHLLTEPLCGAKLDGTREDKPVALAAAVALATSLVPAGTEGVVEVHTDGFESVGSLAAVLPSLGTGHIAIEFSPSLEPSSLSYSRIGSLDVPLRVLAGDVMPLSAAIFSQQAEELAVEFTIDGIVEELRDIRLEAGWNRVTFTTPVLAPGAHFYGVSVGDQPGQSTTQSVHVADAPNVAIVTPDQAWGEYLGAALEVHGIVAKVLRPDRAPFRMDGWLAYDAVLLANTPALDLGTVQQQQLEEYVRLHGRGLLLLGGENTFGPGGYFRTPLEDVSPLSARAPNDLPVAALALVIDRSGSMQAQVDGSSRLEIAKQATVSAVELLNDESQISVVVFDTEPHVVSPMQSKDVAQLATALQAVQPGGGTFFMPALELALAELDKADAPVRHIILMSDGLSQPGDYDGFALRAKEEGISLSVVAIGAGADVGRLASIARNGGGAFHRTDDFRALPSILSQEAMMLSGEPMIEGVQSVFWNDRDAPFLAGALDALPPVQGLVATTAKPGARVHMEALDADGDLLPLLASWQYGNGSVLAFSTHGAGTGTAQWLGHESFPLLWSQAVRQFVQTGDDTAPLSLARFGDTVRVTSMAGATEVTVTGQDGIEQHVVLTKSVDGTSWGSFVAKPDTYTFVMDGSLGSHPELFTIPYASVLDPYRLRVNPEEFARLAGTVGTSAQTPAFPYTLVWGPSWRPWLVLALLTFMAELALRYAGSVLGFFRLRRATH